MPIADALHWNERYQNSPNGWFSKPRSFLVDNKHFLPKQGLALDVAMGIGSNASFLAEHGLTVLGIDISSYAVRKAKQRSPQIMAVIGDLTNIHLPSSSFDVIINFYYLQRNLIAEFSRLLKPRGVVIFETLTQEIRSIKPEVSATNLLNPGEACGLFSHWDIIYHYEGWTASDHGKQKAVARVIARLP